MVKLIGAAIILFSATMAGWQMGRYYAFRPVQIRALILALQMLETEIVYGSTQLHRAFVKIGQRVMPEIGQLFTSAAEYLLTQEHLSTAECWQQSLDRNWTQTALRKDEKEILLGLGQVLGTSDREDQQRHLLLAVSHLRAMEEESRVEQGKYEKMYKSLGFLCGLFIVILMF